MTESRNFPVQPRQLNHQQKQGEIHQNIKGTSEAIPPWPLHMKTIYDLLRATNLYNTRAQVTRMEPIVHHVTVLATNIQGQHQFFFIDPTTGASLYYRQIFKGPAKAI